MVEHTILLFEVKFDASQSATMRGLLHVLLGVAVLVHTSEAFLTYYPPTVVEVEGSRCLTDEEIEMKKTKISSDISDLLRESVITPCGPGWTRVAFLNMSDPTEQCPSSWLQDDTSEINGCGRPTNGQGGCDSVSYPTGVEYTQVCGKVLGHQFRSTDAFGFRNQPSIDSPYVDGVSITHASPRQHIWSFASAYAEDFDNRNTHCPCDSISTAPAPPFVGDNYFCETGFEETNRGYGEDPLWDGEGCSLSECCSFNSPPLFTVSLPAPTTDDLEVRVCGDQRTSDENIFIELLELYVK